MPCYRVVWTIEFEGIVADTPDDANDIAHSRGPYHCDLWDSHAYVLLETGTTLAQAEEEPQ